MQPTPVSVANKNTLKIKANLRVLYEKFEFKTQNL